MSVEAMHLQAAAAWLRLGQRVDALARLLLLATLLAGVAWVYWSPSGSTPWTLAGLCAALLAGWVQCVYAARVQFDADLFAQAALQAQATHTDDARRQLDAALLQLRLLPPAKAGREWPARIAGARRLLRRQCGWHLAQWFGFAVALGLAASAHAGT